MPLLYKGFDDEANIVKALDNRKFVELNQNMKYILKLIYGYLDEDTIIHASLVDGFKKPDFTITINNETKYVSMKSGNSDQIHEEKISTFIDFLKSNGISQSTIETILYVHYSDGTLDGTGKVRMGYHQVGVAYENRIKSANLELNSDIDFILKALNRFLFQGSDPNDLTIDYLYHGNDEYGILVSRNQIIKRVKRNDYHFYRDLHIGPMLFKPHARYAYKEIKNEKYRHIVRVNWPNLCADMTYISTRFSR